ncbi:MAG: cyclic lactone autoinducer peptide [Oscillospiraceae bacterium]|nr:cyclic lactone autoinducer peptide [Oscillospiraceae bacterium]
MNVIKTKVVSAMIKITYHVAEGGAGLASFLGIYQPKVPKKLRK